MKNFRVTKAAVFAAVLLATTIAWAAPADNYGIDPVHTTAFFKVGHLGIGFVRGAFTDISGSFVLDKAKPGNSSIQVTIGTASVNTFNEKRDDDLRSDNFLDAKNYPTMGFKSASIKKLKNGAYDVAGDFTLHGVTKRIKVKAKFLGEGSDPWGGHRAAMETTFTIKRSDYGMTKEIPLAGDAVEITVVVEGVRK